MPGIHGKNGKILIQNTSGTFVDISGDFNNVTMTFSRENPETTTFGYDTVQRIAGIRDVQIQFAGIYNTGTNTAACVIPELMAASLNTVIKWAPGGCVSGCRMWTASFLPSSYEEQGPNNAPIGVNATFQMASGSLSASTV